MTSSFAHASVPFLGDGYIGGVASLCSHTAMIIHIPTNIHTYSLTNTRLYYTSLCANLEIQIYQHTDISCVLTTSGFVFVHVMSDSDSGELTRLHSSSNKTNCDPCSLPRKVQKVKQRHPPRLNQNGSFCRNCSASTANVSLCPKMASGSCVYPACFNVSTSEC